MVDDSTPALIPLETPLLVLITVPDGAQASALAHGLVAQRLAACVSRLPGLESTYRWEGEIEQATEILLLVKTTEVVYPKLQTYVAEHHPYEVPECIAVPITAGLPAYLYWLVASVDKSVSTE